MYDMLGVGLDIHVRGFFFFKVWYIVLYTCGTSKHIYTNTFYIHKSVKSHRIHDQIHNTVYFSQDGFDGWKIRKQ